MIQTVEIHTLDVGDKFLLESHSEKLNSLYLIYEMNADGWAECVELHSGKTFSFGRAVPVVPVAVTYGVRTLLSKKPPLDLTNKCGSCVHASTERKEYYKNTQSYVRCMNPSRHWHREISAYRPRTTKCCKEYKARENEDVT